jgi:thioredoxin reductase (NADPH)
MAIPDEAVALDCGLDPLHIRLATGERIATRAAVIATGATYRRLDVEGLDRFEGASVHYWASPMEANLCANEEVVLVGGGNSAGQAVVFLAGRAKKLWLLVRKPLAATMSHYLVERIEQLPNVEVVTGVEVSRLEGENGQLSRVCWRRLASGEEGCSDVRHLFSFIGADPNTDWLASAGISRDPRGFLLTGAEAGEDRLALETSRRGVFAVGDVRASSVKRVAASVGDGAQVVALLHAWLAGHPSEQLSVRTVQTA